MHHASFTQVTLLSLALAVTAGCGGSTFKGDSDQAGGKPAPSTGAPPDDAKLDVPGSGNGDGKEGDDEPELTPEQEAIGKCLAAWGENPFGQQAFTQFRKISVAVTIFGKGGYAIEDTQVTDQPKLILVNAGVGVLGDSNMLLMNPNGWYCIQVNVNVLAKSKVELHCNAALADSQVSVNVGSTAQGTAAVGVNVGSDVQVIRKKGVGAEPGC